MAQCRGDIAGAESCGPEEAASGSSAEEEEEPRRARGPDERAKEDEGRRAAEGGRRGRLGWREAAVAEPREDQLASDTKAEGWDGTYWRFPRESRGFATLGAAV